MSAGGIGLGQSIREHTAHPSRPRRIGKAIDRIRCICTLRCNGGGVLQVGCHALLESGKYGFTANKFEWIRVRLQPLCQIHRPKNQICLGIAIGVVVEGFAQLV